MNRKMSISCSIIIVSLFLSGCGSRAAFNQRNFLLEASRNIPQQKTGKDIILDVKNFTIDRAFGTKNFVYRKGRSEYETDFYSRFLISPEDMITEKTRLWLSNSGLFKHVLESGSYIDATHLLEGNITALYGDFSNVSSPKAIMEIHFFIIKLSDRSIVFEKTYEAQSSVGTQTAETLVEAFDKCLVNILSNLEHDLQERL